MRFRESIQLDAMIDERRRSLASHSGEGADQKARALLVLIEARDRLDAITSGGQTADQIRDARKDTRILGGDFGGINVVVNGPSPYDSTAMVRELKRNTTRLR